MKYILSSLRMLLVMTLLTGVIYPLAVTLLGQGLFSEQARGHLIRRGAVVIGSKWVGQNFKSPRYFWPRPSATDYNPLPSGGSNLGPTSADLKKTVEARREFWAKADPGAGEAPQDLLFASGSGLDPEISPEAARYQAARVAKARGMDRKQLDLLIEKIQKGPQLGIFGEPRVNVLNLNLALDQESP